MALELVLIWTIVVAAIVWFVRDERERRQARLREDAMRFATQPQWRHRDLSEAAPGLPVSRTVSGGLSSTQRKFFEELTRQGQ